MRSLRPNMKNWSDQTDLSAVTVVEAKYDGHWLSIVRGDFGALAYGRKEDPDNEIGQCLERFHWYSAIVARMPKDSVICGEMYVPGKKASAVSSALAGGDLPLKFVVFAAPRWNGVDLLAEDPRLHREFLRSELLAAMPYGVDITTQWSSLSFAEQTGLEELTMRAICVQRGWEGFVFKERSFEGWYKWKVEHTCDVVCLGSVDGRGKYSGQVGALRGALWVPGSCWGPEICRCSGMTDDEREQMTVLDYDDELVGRVFEVEYQYVGDGGRLRHPRFVRWREDKQPEGCGLEQFDESDRELILAGHMKKGGKR